MSLSIVRIVPKAGMSYVVTENGAADVKVPYQVVLSEPLGAQSLITAFTSLDGDIPSIGTEHPARPGYYVARYDVKQPTGNAKASLDVDVVYSPRSYVTEGGGGGEPGTECNIEQWGWDDGTAERELVQAVDGTQVLNSAKDPFDSVPTVSTPSPTFTKVVRFGERKSGGRCRGAQLASIRQMSGQVSRGSAGEYQADERAGVPRLSWRVSSR